jgi:dolichol kinase
MSTKLDPNSATARKQSLDSVLSGIPTTNAPTFVETQPEQFGFRPLTYRELRRRFWHMSPGLLAFALHVVSHADPMTPTLRWIIVGFSVAIGMKIFLDFRKIQRKGEGAGTAAVAGYAFSVLLTILLFPRHLEIGLAVLSILAFGDGSATLFGLMFRGRRLPWNTAKSWTGLLSFFAVGTLMTAWIYCGETHNPEASDPAVSFPVALALVAPAVIAAGLAESLKSRINDNVRVGAVAAVVMATVHFLFRPF